MAFKRALWHSGLTYRQTCRNCKNTITYKDDALDFRPWFADGFIYCPQCQTPLRHNEAFAVDRPADTAAVEVAPAPQPTGEYSSAFCPKCGKAFKTDDIFCSGCGAKRT